MPDNSRLDRVFAELLRHHAYGWALFKKVTAEDMHPGSCGYFDSEGDWVQAVDLTLPSHDLLSEGWEAPEDRIHHDRAPVALIWGPKTSGEVHVNRMGGTFGAATVVTPVEASITTSYENVGDRGAVLAVESPVLKHQIGDEEAALRWMTANTQRIMLSYGSAMEQHGFWIVTKTYTSRRCAVAVMSGKSSAVAIGLGMTIPGLLSLTPEASWSKSRGDCSTEVHADENGIVVFMSGFYFRPRVLSSQLKHTRDQTSQKNQIFRGACMEPIDAADIEGVQLEKQCADGQGCPW
ncbi:hypothetical protein E8E14_005134 [Neopestalotiopsis sp. 37M]|nr:hypothetical protein E8E14_005134 [Neopestalotiopsis sp. 37M]